MFVSKSLTITCIDLVLKQLAVAFLIYRILLIELSVLSQFQIPLKLRRRVIIARIIRSGYNLIKAWKRLASAKTLQTHFNNRIMYSQKWYFTTSKLLRSTIPKNESLYHTFKKRPQNKSTNNYSIFSTSTKSTINYRKKTTPKWVFLNPSNHSFFYFSLSLWPSLSGSVWLSRQRKSRRLIYKRRNNLENARTKSREQQKKALQVTLIVYRNSSKKVESLDRSGILLCRHNDFDVINGVHSNRLARKKGPFPQSAVERTNNAAHYTT